MTDYRNRITGLEYVASKDLTPHPGNWREHGKAQTEALRGVLAEVGIAGALLAYRSERNGGALTVIDGHLRKDAAPQKWPVLVLDVDDGEADYLLATHDPLAAMATADAAALDALLSSVNSGEAAVQAMLAELAKEAGLYGEPVGDDPGAQVDRAEELRAKWQTESGQLWRLGEHRVICGDCTDGETVGRVMGGERADTLVSDPPYGIGYEYASHDDQDNGANLELVKSAWVLGPVSKVWTCGLMNLQRDLEWNPDARVLCWHKGFAQAGNGLGGASTWEPVIVAGVKGGTLPNDYLSFATDRVPGLRDLHTCPKPVALFEHLIQHLAGAIVYDPFLGSGTTLIACERLGRRCRGIEISPAYVAVTLERWSVLTGKTPELLP